MSTKRTWKSIIGQLIVVGIAVGLLFLLLYPACQQVNNAANSQSRCTNLRKIAVAMHNAHQDKIALSQAICRSNGRPLLSWRVALLPYLSAEDLYKQFKLDEPWDSPHNYALLSKMPDVYKSAGIDLPAHHTLMKVFVTGPGYEKGKYRPLWPSKGQNHLGAVLNKTADAIDSTIMVAEVGSPVPWTKPEDIVIDETIDNDTTKLDFKANFSSNYRPGLFFYAAMADASVRGLHRPYDSMKTDKQLIRPLIGYIDGETLPDGVFD